MSATLASNRVVYMRNLIFGAEDSLVSTVGLLSGIAIGGVSNSAIILTGIVLIFVEAFSMGVGSYLSEYSVEESIKGAGFETRVTVNGASVMFLSYLLCGLVPLWPYLIFEYPSSFYISIASSFIGLFVLGYWSAKILKIRMFKSAARMMLIGGLAVIIGIVVGRLVGV